MYKLEMVLSCAEQVISINNGARPQTADTP